MDQGIFEQFEKVKNKSFADRKWLDSGRQKLMVHMEMNPGTHAARGAGILHTLGATFRHMAIPVSLMLLVVAAAGGVSIASASALPGDALYPWKNMKEKVSLALKVGKEKKIDYQIKIVDRRLQEVAELSVKPAVDLKNLKVATINAGEQIEATESDIALLELDNDNNATLEATVKLQATLDTHEKLIDKLDREGVAHGELKDTAEIIKTR